jgi:hypothetical protein
MTIVAPIDGDDLDPAWATLVTDFINDYISGRTVRKASATSRNTTVARVADPELTLSLPANSTWDFEVHLFLTSAANAAGDIGVEVSYPSLATVEFGPMGLANSLASGATADVNGGTATSNDTTSPSGAVAFGVSTVMTLALLFGRIALGATAGSLTVNWAQDSSNGNNTTVNIGSKLIARRAA